MTKDDLTLMIAARMAEYDKPIYTYAESVDQEKRLKKRIKAGLIIPQNLKQAEWEKYLAEVEAGTYKPAEAEEKQLYDWEGL